MGKQNIVADLKLIHQFQRLSQEDLFSISLGCMPLCFKKGDILFAEGDIALSVYLLINGSVEVWKDYDSKTRDLLAVQKKGHIIGEMAVIDELTRSATIIAAEDLIAYSIHREVFIDLLKRLPELSFEFMKSISMLVRKSNEYIVNELSIKNEKLEKTNVKILHMQEELLKKERLSIVGQFSSMILHDIRNPVTVIMGYSEILKNKKNDPEKVKKYGEAIYNEANSLKSLSAEMLDYTRGNIRLNLAIVELDKLIENVLTHVKSTFTRETIQLKSEILYSEPVLLDYDRIYRVLINICENSRKALSLGGEITIKVQEKENYYEFQVIDDGEGISPELLDKIFDPFTSFSNSGGTGLGMLIVKNIIEAHDGFVTVESEEHLGTKVTISLPLRTRSNYQG